MPPTMGSADFVLRQWQEGDIEYAMRCAMTMLASDVRGDPVGTDFARRVSDPAYLVGMVIGYHVGFFDGASARYLAWKKDLFDVFATARKIILADKRLIATNAAKTIELGLSAGVREFFLRPWIEEVPIDLAPESADSARVLIDIYHAGPFLEWLGMLDELKGGTTLSELVGIAANDLSVALVNAGDAAIRQFLLEHDSQRQGAMLGSLVGAATVELIRIIVEPPALNLAELVATLALSYDERRQLGIQ